MMKRIFASSYPKLASKLFIALAIATSLLSALTAYAAQPVKITPKTESVSASGEAYKNYLVECSNGKSYPIDFWIQDKKWCLGYGTGKDLCWPKQAKAAKQACDAVLAIVVHPQNTTMQITQAMVKDIFLGNTKTFPDGQQVKPVELKENSKARTKFLEKLVGKSESQLRAYWARRIFQGDGAPPKVAEDSAHLKNMMNADKSIIGFMSSESLDESVRAILVMD